MTDGAPSDVVDHLKRYVRTNPDAGVDEILGATGVDLEHIALVEELVAADDVEDVAITTDEGDSDESPDADRDGIVPVEPASEPPAAPTPTESTTDQSSDTDHGRPVIGDALEWYHGQLDHELPDSVEYDTAREYYRQGRGWDADTVDEKLLGYAPPNHRDELIAHLFDRGHDREAILSTGLFGERDDGNLYATWSGRYVLPYFDADGRPVFAISRATDPVHDADWKGNKYDKLQVTRDDVDVEEPVYGLDSVRDGSAVLITEGIADAITAHQAGYPCISPVTTQFKKSDREDVLAALEQHDVDRAYLVQDAERPTSDVDDHDRLTLQQHGEGLKGAVRTAAYLSDHDIDARIADLPRPGLDKVDLDDYLQSWSDDLTAILASSQPVEQHSAYDATTAKNAAFEAAETADIPPATGESDGDRSALFDLDIRDVTGLPWDYRGPNPLGHHGDSENYFVLAESLGLAYDYKYKTAYNALTYLLVDAGERRPDAPNGRLDDSEVFEAWHHAKGERVIPDDDPIPHRALQHVALSHDLADRGELEDGWKLPTDAYNDALDTVRDEHDVEPGRDAIGDSGEPVSTLPLDRLDALDTEERKRYARSHGVEWPTTSDVRDRLEGEILQAVRSQASSVIDAPTSVGKSYTVATTPWLNHASTTNEQPVVHLHKTRDARDAAAAASDQANVSYRVLKGRKERCPVAHGDHDPNPDGDDPDVVVTIGGTPASEWLDAVCDGKGIPFSVAHQYLAEHSDQDVVLPCEADDTECRAMTQWDGIPRNDDGNAAVDVIHATHAFARVPSLVDGCNVILDEQPDFAADLDQDTVRSAITAYLRAVDAPRDTFEALVELATPFDDDGFVDRTAVVNTRNDMQAVLDQEEPPMPWYLENDDAHALAPALTRAVWHALRDTEPDRNGRRTGVSLHEPPRFDDSGENYIADRVTVVVDDENTVRTVRVTPWFDAARSVIGLDAHPSMHLWQQNTVAGVSRESLLDPTERQLWRRFERGLTVVQVGEATRPFTSGEYFDEGGTTAVLEHLRDHYGAEFSTAITASSVERRTKQLMKKAGIDDPETMHYGEEKSRNDFGDEDVGLVNGCIDPGDDYVLDLLAERGLDAEPERVETDDGDVKRAKGRDFVGPDADAARDLLASVRENHVAQSAGRYARDADDPENSAVVFVRTDAIPPELVDVQAPGVERVFTDIQREILETLRSRPDGATAKEIADDLECTKRHVLDYLSNLDDVDREKGVGKHGADVYGAGEVPEHGEADLSLSAIDDEDEDAVVWTLAVHDQLDTTPGLDAATGGRDAARGPAPPDDSDSGGSSGRGET